MKGTTAYNLTYRRLDGCVRHLEQTWRERWERWLSAPSGDGSANPSSFVAYVILEEAKLDADDVGYPSANDNLTWIVDDDNGDAWVQVAFLSSYGEVPAPATLIGFDWFDNTPSDLEQLEPIVSRLYCCLRGLVPALTDAAEADALALASRRS